MCGICGYINYKRNYVKTRYEEAETVRAMAETMKNRGPDAGGEWIGEHAVLGHRRLAVIDPENGAQPMKRVSEGYEFVIVYNGEMYNTAELRRELIDCGYEFETNSDTEVLLYAVSFYIPRFLRSHYVLLPYNRISRNAANCNLFLFFLYSRFYWTP